MSCLGKGALRKRRKVSRSCQAFKGNVNRKRMLVECHELGSLMLQVYGSDAVNRTLDNQRILVYVLAVQSRTLANPCQAYASAVVNRTLANQKLRVYVLALVSHRPAN